jgi:hypothetical protein
MYRVMIERHRNNNPLTGRARYRVVSCLDQSFPLGYFQVEKVKVYLYWSGGKWKKMMAILSDKPRQPGSFINPTWALFGRKAK